MNYWKKIVTSTLTTAKQLMGSAVQLSTTTMAAAKKRKSSDSSGGGGGSGRPMKFPYTFTAKIVQFPWLYYIKNNWVYRYYFISIILCLPIFKKIDGVFNSPANKKKWEEIKKKEALEEHHRR